MVTSHLGRPTEGEFKPADSLAPVAARLSELLGQEVALKQNWVDGAGLENLAAGQVVLLENVRVNKGEKKNSDELAQKMAKLCDIYVNDAFGTAHRAEASTHGIAKFAPVACAGPLLAAELDALGKALHAPARPLLAIVAGSKVSSKLTILKALSDKVDNLIVGGGIANTFMKAVGLNVGKSLVEAELVEEAKAIIEIMAKRGAQVPIPVDVVCAKEFSPTAAATVKDVADVADDDMILDIGPKTAALLAQQIAAAGTIVWNGPVSACSNSTSSATAPRPWRWPLPNRKHFPSLAVATPWRRLPNTTLPIKSAISRRAAALSWSSWKARLCRPWKF